VLQLAREHDIPVEERPLPAGALTDAEEALLTSTTREVHAIARVDDRDLPSAPGAVTTRLAQAFRDLVARDMDP
jgi:branched-chain amino acid aminotransferase